MPWYRIFANHGPGHQSSTEVYHFFEKPLNTKERRDDAWEEVFGYGEYDDPSGGVELCDKLPQHIHDSKIKSLQSEIEHAHKMLDVLKSTPTKPVICVRLEAKAGKVAGKPDVGFRARLMNEPKVLGPTKPKRDEAVDALLSMFRKENRKVLREKKGMTRFTRRKDYAVITQ